LTQARERARAILEPKKDLMLRLAKVLMARETIEGSELKAWVDGDEPVPEPDEEPRAEEATRRLEPPEAAADGEAGGDGARATEEIHRPT
ncbi:MAG TPA: hypothetical protein VF058_04485, partial [Actinomycetota bacterium]